LRDYKGCTITKRKKVNELAERAWDVQAIEARIKKLAADGYGERVARKPVLRL
jgi:hypothetical protein